MEEISIGENIRRIRIEKGLTQAELSERVHVTQSMLCCIERGTKACSMGLGAEIARELGCAVVALYEGAETQTQETA